MFALVSSNKNIRLSTQYFVKRRIIKYARLRPLHLFRRSCLVVISRAPHLDYHSIHNEIKTGKCVCAVSYTHLDVYKRQK